MTFHGEGKQSITERKFFFFLAEPFFRFWNNQKRRVQLIKGLGTWQSLTVIQAPIPFPLLATTSR